jgi:microcystin-dependent protein
MQPFLGEVKLVPYNFAPKGWAFCDGRLLQIAQNNALFALLGTTYGGDGQRTFGLPDLRGRTPIHMSATHPLGVLDGTETVALTTQTMPVHAHALVGSTAAANDRVPLNGVFANDSSTTIDYFGADSNPLVTIAPQTIGMQGSSLPHLNTQPSLVLTYCIALSGIFPSRN